MAVCLQVVGLMLGVASWCLASSCTSSQLWRVRSQAESMSSSQRQFEGLWMSCAASSLGSLQCSRFKTTLGLPVHLQVCRALMILSLMLGLTSTIVSVLGLKCTKIGRISESAKEKMALTGGLLLILSGVFSLSAVSWYASRIIHEFHDPLYGGVRFELGTGLYFGWASAGMAVLGGSMLCSSCRKTTPLPSARQVSYSLSPTTGGEQIYRAAPPSESSSKAAYV
ncbi:hypothetical protein CgunFtcFv8_010109 [Champsocephalus gunnari]|uniref:Claudin n=1 Tax=Champsocephalus gunnari TaxID=52237 RepID=A0AAN8HV86_CHAGU|nr:hypothetical protein CgunFtcFv8_010109 [Champsocephalus gunnari]